MNKNGLYLRRSNLKYIHYNILANHYSTIIHLYYYSYAVKEAVEMNRKLQYVNEHQKCIMEDYRKKLEVSRQELVETRVLLADAQAERNEGREGNGRNTRTTEQQLKMVS